MSRAVRIYSALHFMRIPSAFLLITLAVTGCASSGNRTVYTQPENELKEWSQTSRTILVTDAGDVPDAVLLVQDSQMFVDTAKGAGKGLMVGLTVATLGCRDTGSDHDGWACALGIVILAPPLALGGLAVGGIVGAAGSEPIESSYSLSHFEKAPVLIDNASGWQDLERMLSTALIENADEHVHHAFQHHRHVPPGPNSTGSGFQASASSLDYQWRRPGTIDGFEALLRNGNVDGVLVVDLVQRGFVSNGEPESEDADPELKLVLRASLTLHFSIEDEIENTRFETQRYESSWHRLSDFTADNGSVLTQELENGVDVLSDHLLTDLKYASSEHRLKTWKHADLRGHRDIWGQSKNSWSAPPEE